MAIDTNSALRHEVYVSRLATEIINSRVAPTYFQLAEMVKALLVDYEPGMPRRDFDALRKKIQKEVEELIDGMWAKVGQDMAGFATYEAGYWLDQVDDYGTPTALSEAAIATATAEPMVLVTGATKSVGIWSEFVQGAKDSLKFRVIDNVLRAGQQDGLTTNEIVRQIVGRKKLNYADGLIGNMGRREAESLVRTGLNHYANQTRLAFGKRNQDILQGYILVVTFDNRTSLTCRHYGQLKKIYPLDDPRSPRPPFHYGCRTTMAFAVKGVDPWTGTRSAVGGKKGEEAADKFERREDALDARRAANAERRAAGEEDVPTVPTKPKYRGRKDSDVFDPGQIDASKSMDAWMRQQPAWFQDSSLGKTRAKLFRDGGLSIDKFTDMNGRPLTLKEMRELDEFDAAFRKAGL